MSLINENIEQMRLLINYNPKLTLTENNQKIILEGGELSKLLQVMGKDSKALLKAELEGLESVTKMVGNNKKFTNIEELLTSIQAGRTNANDILKDVLKNPSKFSNKFPEIYKTASSNYAHQLMNSKSELAIQFQNASLADRKVLLQKAGYSKQSIEKITQEVKSIEKTKLKSSISNKTSEKVAKEQALSKETRISKNSSKFKEYYGGGKGRISDLKKKDWVKKGFLKRTGGLGRPIKWVISKRKILAWAAAAGVTYLVLKYWLFNNGVEEEKKTDDGGGSDDGGGGGGTTYSYCSSFPYKKGCDSPIISEVQKCLGIAVDGKFGPQMEKALSLNNYGTEITEDVYNKIKAKCGSTTTITPPTPTPTPLTQDQTYGIEPTPQEFEGGTQTIKINADEI
jgi:hypothetical protein